MRETPIQFNAATAESDASCGRYPAENLSRFSWHTGAAPRPLSADEGCPVLFRDIGPVAMARFLRGRLRRLAGPFSPITYMRTAEYAEPYIDYERIGRLVFLRPLALQPWHSGVETIYVADAARTADPALIGFVPGDVPLAAAAERLDAVRHVDEMREVFGRAEYDDAVGETLNRLDQLNADHDAAERLAEPLRRALQSPDRRRSDAARRRMEKLGLSEGDLCAAWHHLPRERRALIRELLPRTVGINS